jgi:hypothetical protein
MRSTRAGQRLAHRLAAYGSDLRRWPAGAEEARAALLNQPEFRRAWQREREFERSLAEYRDLLDAEIARSGAITRMRRDPLAENPIAGMPWWRVAAVVFIAGMLGGALDLMLPETTSDPLDVAIVDPLDGLDETEMR